MAKIYDERTRITELSSSTDDEQETITLVDATSWPSPIGGGTASGTIDFDDLSNIESFTHGRALGHTLSGDAWCGQGSCE